MVVYVGQCGDIYSGPTFPHHHGKECDLRAGHEAHGYTRHTARVAEPLHFNTLPGERTYALDRIEWFDPAQKRRRLVRAIGVAF